MAKAKKSARKKSSVSGTKPAAKATRKRAASYVGTVKGWQPGYFYFVKKGGKVYRTKPPKRKG